MRRLVRPLLAAAVAVGLLALPPAAGAEHDTRPHTNNMHALGHAPNPATFFGVPAAQRTVNSDIAFWGDLIFNGNYDGFRIIKNSPGNPKLISWTRCTGDQGDIVVYGDVLVRSWNTGQSTDRMCDGEVVPAGFEGFHVFDISNLEDPELVGSLELSNRPEADAFGCGSHTATGVPDLENNRLLIYNQTSGGPCPFVGIIEVPLDDPGSIQHLSDLPQRNLDGSIRTSGAAHDSGVILGDANLLAVAGHTTANVFDIGDNEFPGGSLEDPEFLFAIEEEGVCNVQGDPLCNGNWHSAGFSWDGETIILGWEPGGGAAGECAADDPVVKKSVFFYDATNNGEKLGQWTLPRDQLPTENCTIHNYNTVPLPNGNDVLVMGNYQAGTWVVDFTDPTNAQTLGWADPPALPQVVNPDGNPVNELGGAWSSYWYNGFIYESEITKGLNVFRFSGRATSGAMRLPHLNPQTQEFSLP